MSRIIVFSLILLFSLNAHADHEAAADLPEHEVAPMPAKVEVWPPFKNCLDGNSGGFTKQNAALYKQVKVAQSPSGRIAIELGRVTENPGVPPVVMQDYEYGLVRAQMPEPVVQRPGLSIRDAALPEPKNLYEAAANRVTVAQMANGRQVISLRKTLPKDYFGRPIIPNLAKLSLITTFDNQGSYASFIVLEDSATPPKRQYVAKDICSPQDDGQALGISAAMQLVDASGISEPAGVRFPSEKETNPAFPTYRPSRGNDPKAHAEYIERLRAELAAAEKRKAAIESGEYRKDALLQLRHFLITGKLPD